MSASPSIPAPGGDVSIHVRASNPSDEDWQDHRLLLGYAQADEASMVQIADLPFSLAAQQVYEQDIAWRTDSLLTPGANYQIRLVLVSGNYSELAQSAIPIAFAAPTVSVAISPDQLSLGAQALIQVGVVNPSESTLDGLTLGVLYGAVNDPGGIVIEEVALSLGAGESLSHEIAWTVDYVPAAGSYEVRAFLLLPDNSELTSAAAPVELLP